MSTPKICAWCNEGHVKRNEGKFCSRLCSSLFKADACSTMRRRACAWCRKIFTPDHRKQRSCSRRCGGLVGLMNRPDDYYKKLGQIGNAALKVANRNRWLAQVKDMTPVEAANFGFKKGYQACFDRQRRGQARRKEQAA